MEVRDTVRLLGIRLQQYLVDIVHKEDARWESNSRGGLEKGMVGNVFLFLGRRDLESAVLGRVFREMDVWEVHFDKSYC